MGKKDYWNHTLPHDDKQFLKYFQHPEVSKLVPVLYPGVFPNLAALTAARADIVAILLTGIPNGIVPGFQNFTGPTYADMLRLNLAIKPTAKPNALGVVGWRPGGIPQRAPTDRRRLHHRAACARRGDVPAGRAVVHARRCGLARHGRVVGAGLPRLVPVPQHPARRLLRSRMTAVAGAHVHPHPHVHPHGGGSQPGTGTRRTAVRWSSTSEGTSGPSYC